MTKVKFVLNERLGKIDSLGEGYVYNANPHPTISDIMIVHYGEDESTYYYKEDFDLRFTEGHWIKVN